MFYKDECVSKDLWIVTLVMRAVSSRRERLVLYLSWFHLKLRMYSL